MKEVKKVIGIKCFDMDLTCRGYQFELGKTYEIQGELKLCVNGFHFYHHSQLEYIFSYYYPSEGTRYCLVIGENVIMNADKSVARKITILKELSLQEVIDIRTRKMTKQGKVENLDECGGIASQTSDYGIANQIGDRGIANQTGNYGMAIQMGYCGISSQMGDHGLVNQSGYQGLAGQTGDNGMAIQKGEYGIAVQTGYCGLVSQKGYQGLASQTGHYGSAVQDGEYGMAIALGKYGRAMVKNNKGAIVIQNWISDDDNNWQVIGKLCASPGDTLPNGKTMKKNTWYWYEDGELKSRRK